MLVRVWNEWLVPKECKNEVYTTIDFRLTFGLDENNAEGVPVELSTTGTGGTRKRGEVWRKSENGRVLATPKPAFVIYFNVSWLTKVRESPNLRWDEEVCTCLGG